MIRKIAVLAAVLLFAFPFTHADEAIKRAKFEEMFTILEMDSLIKQVMNQSLAQDKDLVKGLMGDTPVTPADQKIMDDYISKMFIVVTDTLSSEKLKPAYVDLYASAYSEQEIDGILTFYKSPVAKSLLAKTPDLITKSGVFVNERIKDLGPRMQEVVVDLQKQLRAAHSDKTPSK